jgi:copper chaperone CopZ
MKWLLALLIAAAGVAAVYLFLRSPEPTYSAPKEAEQASVPRELASRPSDGEIVCTLDVSGMCCNGCSAKLHRALAAVPGVREAAVDFGSKSASAIVPSSLDIALLERALTFDDYAARARR